MASVPLQYHALLSLAIPTAAAAGYYPSAVGAAGSAERRPLQDMQLGSTGLTLQPVTPSSISVPALAAETTLALLPGAVSVSLLV